MSSSTPIKLPWVGLILVLLLPACGSGLISPRGRVLKDGQPVTVRKNEQLMVTFWPLGSDGQLADDLFPAAVNQNDATFECRGRKFKGIPPGKYKIALKLAVGVNSDRWHDALDAKKSPFTFDLTDDDEELVLEVGEHLP